jgi:hypothetical protein
MYINKCFVRILLLAKKFFGLLFCFAKKLKFIYKHQHAHNGYLYSVGEIPSTL